MSCLLVSMLAPLVFPIVWCLSSFLPLHASSWELDSQQCCTGTGAKEEEQKT